MSDQWEECFCRTPISGIKYFLLLECNDLEIAFYSKGISWENDMEVRAPRAVNGSSVIEYYRAKSKRIPILNETWEIEMWMARNGREALVVASTWSHFQTAYL